MLELKNVSKSFLDGESELQTPRGIDRGLQVGHSLALLGANDSGRSTLLNVAAGLDAPDAGKARMLVQRLQAMSERQLAEFHRRPGLCLPAIQFASGPG